MNNDPANECAKLRSRLQLSRELEFDQQTLPHPKVGGTRGYPVWFRWLELMRYVDDLEPSVAHPRSVRRWIVRQTPYSMTGNAEKRDLVGADLILFEVISIVYPQASQDEMALYIYSKGGGLYNNTLVSKRLGGQKVTYKKVSMEANEDFSPRNLL